MQLPPQSVSVSVPFITLSKQDATRHSPLAQTPLEQSVAVLHVLPGPHLPQVAPPQSGAVSSPFCTRSVHDGSSQAPSVQTLVAQSPAFPQRLPLAQGGH